MASASFSFPPSPFNGAQGSAAHAEKVGKGNHNGYDGQAEPQPCEGEGCILRYHSYINAVHDVIQHIDELRQGHGDRQLHDISHHAALGKIVFLLIVRFFVQLIIRLFHTPTTFPYILSVLTRPHQIYLENAAGNVYTAPKSSVRSMSLSSSSGTSMVHTSPGCAFMITLPPLSPRSAISSFL